MSITFEHRAIKVAMKQILTVAPARTSPPVWGVVRITAGDNGVYFTATDGTDQYMKVQVEAEWDAALDVAVNSGDLHRLIGKGPGLVKMTASASGVQIQANGQTSTLPTFPIADLPEWPVFETGRPLVRLRADTLGTHIRALQACISSDIGRYYLQVAALQSDKTGRITMCATDGHKLTRRVLAAGCGDVVKPYSHIIPYGALKVLSEVCKAAMPECMISFTETTIKNSNLRQAFVVARSADITLYTRAIDGTFPEWSRVIPGAAHCRRLMTIDRAALVAFAKNAKTMRAPRVVIHNSPAETLVHVTAKTDEHFSEGSLAGDYTSELGICFNAGYLVQVLSTFNSPMVHFHCEPVFKDADRPYAYMGNPVVITDDVIWRGEPADQALVVLMPIRIPEI